MLTIFSTPKPFRGLDGLIQRNAIKSWTLLRPSCEVILFGDEEGASGASAELRIKNESKVRRAEDGTKFLNHIFEQAQAVAKNDLVSYVNCDIILMSDFLEAVKTASSWSKDFLMIGRRCDVDITEPIDFSKARWEKYLKAIAFEKGRLHGRGIDYFVFSRGLYKEMPPLVIGRNWWDNWLVWKARSLKVPVIDASGVVTAIHQNHDYSYHPEGLRGIVYDSGSRYNLTLGGTWRHFHMLEDAPYRLTPDGVSKNPAHIFNGVRREARHMWDVLRTRSLPVRERIGLNRKNINRFFKPHEDRDKDIWRSQ